MFYDPLYLIISLPLLFLGLASSLFLRIIYSKYNSEINSKNINGIDTVTQIAQKYNFNVDLQRGYGTLTDHYNPITKTVSLSEDVAMRPTIASVGIAAHEMGHVAQHHNSFFLMSIRTTIAPVVSIGSNLGYIIFVVGLIFNIAGLAWIGILFFSGTTLFTLITLPVEIDASRRAIKMVRELKLVDEVNIGGVRMVLFAAALTYVAATIQSAANLLYFILRARGIKSEN